MKKYINELTRIEKRIDAIRENKYYTDYDYHMQELDKKIKKAKTLKQNQELHLKKKFITLKCDELENELNTLERLKEGYTQLIEDYDIVSNMEDIDMKDLGK